MPVSSFVHESLPGRIVFGTGAADRVAGEVAALGSRRVLLIASRSATATAGRLRDELRDRVAGTVDEVAPHVPQDRVVVARQQAAAADADGIVCVGGGSATGLAKAVAVAIGAPLVAVPTTYAGSEMTPTYGITGTHKVVRRDARALPRVVVYDPALTVSMPARTTATSGFNALAHAAVALLSTPDPITGLLAAEAIRRLVSALPVAVADPSDLGARADALLGAHLAGSALAAHGPGLHHRLCHAIGGDLRLVHAEVHTVLLPHTVALTGPPGNAALAAALGTADPATYLFDLATALGAPTGLAELGATPAQLDAAAAAVAGPAHPASVIRPLLANAYAGDPPHPGGAPDVERHELRRQGQPTARRPARG